LPTVVSFAVPLPSLIVRAMSARDHLPATTRHPPAPFAVL